MSKHFKKYLQWLLIHAFTVFSCVAIIALGMGAIAYATTIGTNISTGGSLTVSSSSNMATTTISSGDLIVDTDTLYVDNDNNYVGIGQISPTAFLDIKSSALTTAAISTTELVTDGDMSVPASWTAGTGWAVGSGWAVWTVGTAGDLSQNITVVSGSSYVVQWDMSLTSANSSSITPKIGAVSGTTISLGVDDTATSTEQQIITAGASGSLALAFTPAKIGSGSGYVYIDNVSVKQLTLSPAMLILTNSTSGTNLEMRAGGYNLENTFIGNGAGRSNTTSSYNSAMGYNALNSNTTGTYNSAMGWSALRYNTTGIYNSAMGGQTLVYNTTGSLNSAMGLNALLFNTTGSYNAAMGSFALVYSTTGSYNSAMGFYALGLNSSGSYNSAMGMTALHHNTTGSYNSAMGYDALKSNTTGIWNSALGYQAGYSLTTGTGNTFLGYYTNTSLTSAASSTAIGAGATITTSNQLVVGSSTAALTNSYWGQGVTASAPSLFRINATGGLGTDITGGNLNLAGGQGTGAGLGGSLVFETAPAGSSGTSLNSLVERMRITSTGNVGIGTTTPNNKLTIYNTSKAGLEFSGASGGTYKWTIGLDMADAGKFKIASSTTLGTTDRLVIDGNGKVGIGTSTPPSLFTVENSAASTTVQIMSGSSSAVGGSIILEDTDGAGCSQISVLNGVLTTAQITCPY